MQLPSPACDGLLLHVEVGREVHEQRRREAVDRFSRAHRQQVDRICGRDGAGQGRATLVGGEGFVGARAAGAVERRNERGRGKPLAGQRDMSEVPLEQRTELVEVKLLHVELIALGRGLRVSAPIGRGDHQHPRGTQDPPDLGEHLFVAVMVLDRLERHHHVYARVGQRDRVGPTLHEVEVVQVAVGLRRTCDRLRGDVDADHAARDRRHGGAAVPLAAGDVGHVQPAHQRLAQRVAVQVLVADLPANARQVPLAGPAKARSVGHGRRCVVHRSVPRSGECRS